MRPKYRLSISYERPGSVSEILSDSSPSLVIRIKTFFFLFFLKEGKFCLVVYLQVRKAGKSNAAETIHGCFERQRRVAARRRDTGIYTDH